MYKTSAPGGIFAVYKISYLYKTGRKVPGAEMRKEKDISVFIEKIQVFVLFF